MADPEYRIGFELAAQFRNDYSALSSQFVALQPVTRAFIRNMNRVRGIGIFPIRVIALSTLNEAARVEALVNKNVPFHDPRITRGNANFDEQLWTEVDSERKRLIEEWQSSAPNFDSDVAGMGISGLNDILNSTLEENWDAVQATMAAMLLGLWTAFESFMQDTWVVVVNARPVPLAQRVVEPSANLETGMQMKQLSMKEIANAGFDLRGAMGTLLLRQKAVDFQQFKTIRAAYKVAFAGELESAFEPYAVELSFLEAVRNLFAHKGGVIDEKFLNRARKRPGFSDAKVGNMIGIGGAIVAQYANTVADCATGLINALDKWLTDNPARAEST
jgi:hypothetical protein